MTLKSWIRTNPVLSHPYRILGDWYWRRQWAAVRRKRDAFVDQAALHYADVDRAIAFALASTRYVVDGDVAMFGLTGALFPLVACKWLKAFGEKRSVHLFDSWKGYGPPAPSDLEIPEVKSGGWKFTHIDGQVSPSEMKQAAEGVGHPGRVVIHEGWFSDTLPKLSSTTKFAVTILDPGLFSANDEVLTHLFSNRMIPDGAVVMFNTWNAGRASPRHCARAAWAKAVQTFQIEYSDEGPFHWSGRKFIVQSSA
jgi:hypothetical protein